VEQVASEEAQLVGAGSAGPCLALTNVHVYSANSLCRPPEFLRCGLCERYLVGTGELALRKFSERFCRMILTLYYIPTIFAGVVTVAVWRWFYRYPNGGLNNILDSLHLPTISWLGTPITAPWALGFLMMGTMFGFSTLLYVAAIGQIDLELLGAAKIDGANEFQLIWYIITPLTHRVRLYITLISTVGALSIWEHPFFYTGGGPIGSTTTVLLKVYQEAFARDNIGLGSAMTTVTTSIILIFAIFGVRYFREFLG